MTAISRDFSSLFARRKAASSLRLPSSAASAAWISAATSSRRERRLDLGEAGQHAPGFAGDRQRIERRALQQPLGLRRQIGGDLHLALEAAGEHVALDRFVDRRARAR